MDKNEKIAFVEAAEKYIDNHKIYDLFEHLTKQLLIKRPSDPLDFLIEELSHPKFQRIIFINGPLESHNNEVSNALANEFHLKNISVEGLIQEEIKKKGAKASNIQESLKECLPIDDNFVNEIVFNSIIGLESNCKGAIVNGYPKTLQQALFIQEKGIIPEKFFILEFPETKILKEFENKIAERKKDDSPEKILERANLLTKIYISSIQDLKRVYDSLYTSIDVSDKTKETLISLVKGILQPRTKKIYPLRPPRILIVRPPGIKTMATKIANILAGNFDLEKVLVSNLVQQEIEKKSEIGKFSLEKLALNESIPDDIIGSLMKTSITKTSSKYKGWILEGFPKSLIQFNKFTGININPHLVVILDENEESLKSKFGKILLDPETFKSYEAYEMGQDFNEGIKNRLINHPKYGGKNVFQIIEEYKSMIKTIYNHYSGKCFIYKLDNFNIHQFLKETKEHLNDSKIYN